MATGNGLFHLPPVPDNPLVEPQTINSDQKTTRAPREREVSEVVKDGMRYQKIVEFPFPDRFIPLGKVEVVETAQVVTAFTYPIDKPFVGAIPNNSLQCNLCGFIAKNKGGLNLHKITKKHGR
jgi:hypothetical protein